MTDDEIINLIRVNIYHPMLLAKSFADKKGEKSGLFVMLSSLSAFMPFPGGAIYGATKRFDLILGQAMQYEHLNTVIHSPLAVQSNMTVKSWSWVFLEARLAVKAALGHEKIGDEHSRGPFTQEVGTRLMVELVNLFPYFLKYFWFNINVHAEDMKKKFT